MQTTRDFSKAMEISQRTAAAWAQAGHVRAQKIDGKWIIEDGEPARLKHEYYVNCFIAYGHDTAVAEILACLMELEPEERKKARADFIKVCKALCSGMDAEKFNKLGAQRGYHDIDAMIAECMPSTH